MIVTHEDIRSGEPVQLEFVEGFTADFLQAWNSHDPRRLTALAHPDVLWEDPFVEGGHLVGHTQLEEWLSALWRAVPDLTFELQGEVHLASDGSSAMAAWRGRGTMTGPLVPPGFAPTGGPIEMTGVDTHWYRDGRLVRVRTVTDVMHVARQIGAAPRPGGTAERMNVAMQRLAAFWRRRLTTPGRQHRDHVPMTYADAGPLHKASRAVVARTPPSLLAATFHRLDLAVHRLTGGRTTFTGLVGGLPVVLLTTRGARTGRQRTWPLVAIPHERGLAVAASNWGRPRNPGWYHNLRADPHATAELDGGTTRVRATEAAGAERERLWRAFVEHYPGYQAYERRAAPREIPVLVLTPTGDA